MQRTGRKDRSRPAPLTANMRDEFASFGLKLAVEEQDDSFLAVAACNWQSLMAFLDCDTQWRVAGVGMAGMLWIGLDYTACDIVFRRKGYPDPVFQDLRVMEEAALPILNSGDD